jgi:precorrin-3B methylase
MVAVLSSEDPKIYETLVANVLEVAHDIKDINITNDPSLTEFAAGARKLLSGIGRQQLKASPVLRQATADQAKNLIATFGKVSRKFAA